MKTALRLTVTILLLAVSSLSAATHYVSLGSTNPTPPYTNWATAATSIQAAVNVAAANDVVLVTHGVYPGYVSVTNALALLSVNGPQLTVINGGGTNRCAYLTNGASLTGFTLTNGGYTSWQYNGGGVECASTNAFLTNCLIVGNVVGYASGGGAYGGTLYNCTLSGNRVLTEGGGAYGATLYNCTLTGNSASFANSLGGGACSCTLYNCTLTGNSSVYGEGGGAWVCTLYNCTLSGNWARDSGGGADGCTLYNCTLTGNSARYGGGGACGSTLYNCTLTGNSATPCGCGGSGSVGGGAWGSTLYNCIVYFNTSSGATNFDSSSILNYCCTTPLPTNGVGNITNAPFSADGNLRLQSNSPCINAGNNAYVATTADLDGNPRIVSGTVDIGAYEYQGTGSVISYAWLQQYGLPTDGSADYTDPDHDGMNNWQEWVCGTCPTNSASALCLLSALPYGTNATVTWQSVAGVNYLLERSANLAVPFTLLATNIVGQAGTTSYADTNAAGDGPFFYRVGVKSP